MRTDSDAAALARAVRGCTGQEVAAATQRGAIWVVDLRDGRRVVVKRATTGSPTQVAAEAAGLRWLAVPGGPAVPHVYGHDEQWLVTEYVPGGRGDVDSAERFGAQLVALHNTGAPAFGVPPDGGPPDAWIGNAPMANVPGEHWPSWYAEHRVLPYLRSAANRGALTRAQAAVLERVCEEIENLAGPPEPPARLHGDLWSGNVRTGADGRVWLLDPAAHGGHRETDLAMLALFGYPRLDRVLAGYQAVTPLAAGWADRVPLHQLFPLLVHAVLFGGGYGARAAEAARAALG